MQQNQNIKQQQVKPPTERVIDTSQQKIYEEMARYAAHPRYNDYVNEFYAKNSESVTYPELAGLQALRRSVEAGAYARKIIDINRAEAWQYFQDKYRTGGGGSEPKSSPNENTGKVTLQGKASVNLPINNNKPVNNAKIQKPPVKTNDHQPNKTIKAGSNNINNRDKILKDNIPDYTSKFNNVLNGIKDGNCQWYNINNYVKVDDNQNVLYQGKLVNGRYLKFASLGYQKGIYGAGINDAINTAQSVAEITPYDIESIKSGYYIGQGKSPWTNTYNNKYIEAYNKSPIILKNGDVLTSIGIIIPKRYIDTIIKMEDSIKHPLFSEIIASIIDKNYPQYDRSLGRGQQKPIQSVEWLIDKGYFANLKVYKDRNDLFGKSKIVDYLVDHPRVSMSIKN